MSLTLTLQGVMISNIILKIFELSMLSKIKKYPAINDQQFGFKKDLGCSHAVYTMQNADYYFCNRGSNVYVAALNARKVFDRINQYKLFALLKKLNVSECFINVLIDWYGKLSSCVQWNGVHSDFFNVFCGIHQGGILSSILFNVYVDELISQLENKNLGFHVGMQGC